METKALKRQMGAAIAMVLVAAVALGSATFAWFVNNTKVTAGQADVTAKAANTLLISKTNANAWATSLKLENASLSEIVPVSTVGSDGVDLSFVKDTKWATDATDNKNYASEFGRAASGTDYYETSFDVKGSVAGSKLYLDKETTFAMDEATNANKDMLASMRLGLVVDGKTYIYQLDGTELSSRYNTSLGSTSDADGITKAINSNGDAEVINVDNVSKNVGVIPLADTPKDNNTFVSTTNNADLLYTFANSGDVVNVKAYIWMEGSDYDCNTAVVASITSQKLLANLGFAVANATPTV